MSDVQDAEIALLDGDLEGLHVEPVAGEHAHGVAPLSVGGGTAAANLGLVDNVVMDEGSGVDNFNYGGELYRALALVSQEFGGEQQERRTQPFASSGAQVFSDLGDGGDVRDGVAAKLFFNRDNVFTKQVKDFFPVDGGRRSHCP